jgi:hypothetical protein
MQGRIYVYIERDTHMYIYRERLSIYIHICVYIERELSICVSAVYMTKYRLYILLYLFCVIYSAYTDIHTYVFKNI